MQWLADRDLCPGPTKWHLASSMLEKGHLQACRPSQLGHPSHLCGWRSTSFIFKLKKALHMFSCVEISKEIFLLVITSEYEKTIEMKWVWANVLSYSMFSWNHQKFQINKAVLADGISSYCHGEFYHVHLYQGSTLIETQVVILAQKWQLSVW